MLERLFDAALELLRSYNAQNEGAIKENEFLKKVKLMGGTSPEALKSFSFEDVAQALPEIEGIKPVILAKQIAKAWRDLSGSESPERRPISSRKADKLTTEELVAAYDPTDATNPVGERLKKISKGQPCIVFLTTTSNDVDVARTLALVTEIKDGYEGRQIFEGKQVYRVGEVPNRYADENPFYPNRPLRPDGTCDQLNRSWQGIDKSLRQFLRIAIDKHSLVISGNGGRERAHDVLDIALRPDALVTFRSRYPEISLEFDRLEKTGQLPNLKIPLGQPVSQELPSPFRLGGR